MASADLHAGNPRHPDHDAWLLALGRATYAVSRVVGIVFDILRVFGGVDAAAMYGDPLGGLIKRVEGLSLQRPELPELGAFMVSLRRARVTRNDLLHALPVQHGLVRYAGGARARVRRFFTVGDLAAATAELEDAWHKGSHLLYHDDGRAVRAWYASQRSV